MIAMNSIKPFTKKNTSISHAEKILAEREKKKQLQADKQLNLERSIEASIKILVNIGFSCLAIFSIKGLLPYHIAQQSKLEEIDLEIDKIQPRVELLEENFSVTFDPQKSSQVMQKNSYKVDPNLTRIFFSGNN